MSKIEDLRKVLSRQKKDIAETIEAEIMDILAKEITAEIDNEILRDLQSLKRGPR